MNQKMVLELSWLMLFQLALPPIMIQVYRDLLTLPSLKNAVITIGTFDGVHLGHQQIIKQLAAEAERINGETAIITFHPHPRKIVGGPSVIQLLNTLEEKIELLEAKGIQHLVVIPFTEEFADQPANEYIENFLVKRFHPHTIIIGYDHQFGKGRSGDYHLLEDMGKDFNYVVKEIPEHVLNEVIISSTRIRQALLACDIDTANKYLGYPYFFEGKVVKGNQLGHSLGYPTANLKITDEEKLIPGNGVYAVTVQMGTKSNNQDSFKGMMNIGVRPTVDGSKCETEVHIFDFNQQIYDQVIRVTVHHHLRGEIKFSGLEALKLQLTADKEQALKLLA